MTHLTQVDLSYEMAAQGVKLRNGQRLRLRDAYDWHQAAWDIFHDVIPPNPNKGRFAKGTKPQDQPKVPADFLTRLDERPEGYRLLIVSAVEPTRPSWCSAENWRTRPIPEDYFARTHYVFQLRVNPTRKQRVDKKTGERRKNGVRVPLTQLRDQADWLRRKSSNSGFAVAGLNALIESLDDPGRRPYIGPLQIVPTGQDFFNRDGTRGALYGLEFRGVLVVTDPARFHQTFSCGIGSAKAFGFGLLVIAPISGT